MRTKRICALLTACLLLWLAACGRGDTLRLGTGDRGGMYFAYGEAIAALSTETAFDVKNTAGSAANIRLVKEGFLDMAIVQSDTLDNACFGTGSYAQSGAVKGVSAVAVLYTEVCQVIVRADSAIRTVADLQGRRVSIGEAESGTLENALQILAVEGLQTTDLQVCSLSFTDAAEALRAGTIDAFFCTAQLGMRVLTELEQDIHIRAIGMRDGADRRLIKNYGGYTAVTIPAGAYNGQAQAVSAVGVQAVLIAGNKVPDARVDAVLRLLFDHAQQLQQTCGADRALDVQFATQDIRAPFHTGTASFYAAHGIQVRTDPAAAEKTPLAGQDD